MTRLFTILFICCIPSLLTAQNYAPFKSDVSKRFFEVSNPSADHYFFYADTTLTNGNQIVFGQYYTTQTVDYFEDSDCIFWGGGSTMTLDTTWLGNWISYNTSTKKLELYNQAGDTLYFDFSIGFNDSTLMYENVNNKYFIRYVDTQSENVFTQQDSIKTFQIKHYDAFGNVVKSPLNNFEIKLGKNLGLITFFDTHHFPQVETTLQLRGQLYPLLGSYQMTYEEMFDWHIGDILQYRGVYGAPGTPFTSINYKTITVTNRVEDATTVTISYDETFFTTHNFPPNFPTPINTYNIEYPNPIVITKNSDLLGIPFNKALIETNPLRIYTEMSANYCGVDKYSVLMSGDFLRYCDSCRCFGNVDGFGNSYPVIRYTKGLGQTKTSEVGYGSISGLPYYDAGLQYYHVNGEECGTRAYMGIDENDDGLFIFSPNPATDIIQTNIPFESVSIYDLQGKKIRSINKTGNMINVSDLAQGVYTIEFTINQQLIKRKLIKTE